jgi:hypothetical protein
MPTRQHLVTIVVAAAWLGAACASATGRVTAPAPPGRDAATESGDLALCDSMKARWAVGERGTPALLERAQEAAGARSARFLWPGQAVTMEYLASRLNLELDREEIVRAARCG